MTPTDTPQEETGSAQGKSIEVLISGITFGPFTEAKARSRLDEGLVALKDKARFVGDEDWKTLGDVLGQVAEPPAPKPEVLEPAAPAIEAPEPKPEFQKLETPGHTPEPAPALPANEPDLPAATTQLQPVSGIVPPTGRTSIIPPRRPVSGTLGGRGKISLHTGTGPLMGTPRPTGNLAKPEQPKSPASPMPLIPLESSGNKPAGGIRSQILARTSQEPLKVPTRPGGARMAIRSTTGPLSFAPTTTSPAKPPAPSAPEPSGITLPPRFPVSRPHLEEGELAPVPPAPKAVEPDLEEVPVEEQSSSEDEPTKTAPLVTPAPEEPKPVHESGPISPAHRAISVAALASGALPAPRPPAAVTPGTPREEESSLAGDDLLTAKPPTRRRTQVIKAMPGAPLKPEQTTETHSFRPLPSAREEPPATGRTGISQGPPASERAVRRGMANAAAMAATTPLAAITKGGPPPREIEEEEEEETPGERPPDLEEFEPLENFEGEPEPEGTSSSTPLVETRRAALRQARYKRQRQNLLFAGLALVFFIVIGAGIFHYMFGGHEATKSAPPAPSHKPEIARPPEKESSQASPAPTNVPAAPAPSVPTVTPAQPPVATATPPPTPAPAAATPTNATAAAQPPAEPVHVPTDPKVTAHVISGQAAQAKGDFDGAIAEYTQAILLDGKYAAAFGYRAASRQAKGDLEGAIADDDQLLTLDPRNANGFLQRGFVKQANKDLDGAMADYTRALELDPKSVIAFYNRGMIQEQKGHPDAAIADYNKALELNPKLPGAFYNRGNAKMDKSDLDGAIADYTSALQINPKIALAACNRALAEQNSGNLDAALADYDKALALDGKISMAYYNRGLIKEQKDDLEGCITDSTKAIELDPNNAQAYYNRGVALQAKGNLDAAANDLRKFSELAPRNIYADYAHLYLWVITSQQSRRLEANQELANCLDSNWNAEPAQLPSKIASFLLDHISESDLMTVAASTDPKKDRGQHCEALYFAGIKKMLTGNKSGAIDCFHQCLSTGQKDFCEYILAEAQLQAISPS